MKIHQCEIALPLVVLCQFARGVGGKGMRGRRRNNDETRIESLSMKTKTFFAALIAAALFAFGNSFAAMPAQSRSALSDDVRPVFDHYFAVHAALAQDSIDGVAQEAAAIAESLRARPGIFPDHFAQQAERLAQAKNLADARAAFFRMSPHLIDYVKKNRLSGFHMGYCRMQKVAWLQVEVQPANPYMGKVMPRCAWFRELNQRRQS